MYKIINKYIRRQSRQQIAFGSFILVIVLVFVDHYLGPDISFTIFYIVPIVLATWYLGKTIGIYIALETASIWFIADLSKVTRYSNALIPVWNSIIRLSLFLVAIILLTAIRKKLSLEERLAEIDSLTGLANSRSFYEITKMESIRANRYVHPFTIIYIDVDNFKSVNDSKGHEAGDILLKQIADELRSNTRKTDTIARIGGDEFAGLFPETDYAAAKSMLNKVFSQLVKTMNRSGYSVTFSIGAVTFDKPRKTVHEMVRAADNLMYAAKKDGKNNIVHKKWAEKDTET
ncbi:MAG: GGDEF domain-containing protein [Candidatus Aureabacteria bacterium]|nr:GGDEF domain-containing protein [Candidatus Auribacterota bacterium]